MAGAWGCIGGIRWSLRLSPSSSRPMVFSHCFRPRKPSTESLQLVWGWGQGQSLPCSPPVPLGGPCPSGLSHLISTAWGWTGWSQLPFESHSLQGLTRPSQLQLGPLVPCLPRPPHPHQPSPMGTCPGLPPPLSPLVLVGSEGQRPAGCQSHSRDLPEKRKGHPEGPRGSSKKSELDVV